MGNENLEQSLNEFLGSFDIQLEPAEKGKKEKAPTNYGEMIEKTQEKLDEYNQKAEEILERTKMTREQIDAYASDQKNFTKEQWGALCKLKEATEEMKQKTYHILGEENMKQKVEKEKTKQTQRFGKRKDWLPL